MTEVVAELHNTTLLYMAQPQLDYANIDTARVQQLTPCIENFKNMIKISVMPHTRLVAMHCPASQPPTINSRVPSLHIALPDGK